MDKQTGWSDSQRQINRRDGQMVRDRYTDGMVRWSEMDKQTGWSDGQRWINRRDGQMVRDG